jgi:N-methylhydantoinase A
VFETEYRRLYTRTVPDVPIEIVTWRIRVSTITDTAPAPENPDPIPVKPTTSHRVFDNSQGKWLNYGVYKRLEIEPGHTFSGPALVIEDQTTTVVSADFDCFVNADKHLLLTRQETD